MATVAGPPVEVAVPGATVMGVPMAATESSAAPGGALLEERRRAQGRAVVVDLAVDEGHALQGQDHSERGSGAPGEDQQ